MKEFKFKRKVYKDDIQKSLQSSLQNYAIKTFGLMEYKMQHTLGKEKPEFPKPNEAMIDQVISIVEGSTTEDLTKKLVAHIMSGAHCPASVGLDTLFLSQQKLE